MKKSILLTGIVVSLTAVIACRKTNETVQPAAPAFTTLANFFKANGATTQTFAFDAAAGGTFTTPKGTVVEVPGNAFVNTIGLPVDGTVTLDVRDIYTKSDMILSNVTSKSVSGSPLISGGEAFFKYSQNGHPLKLNDANPITVRMPRTQGSTPMELYTALVDTPTGGIKWFPNPNPIDTMNSYLSYQLNALVGTVDPGSLWTNCDHAFDNYTSTNLTITLDPDFYNISSFIAFDNVNTVVSLYPYGEVFTYNYAPLGYHGHLVFIGIKNGKLLTEIQPLTIVENQTVELHPTENNAAALKQQLEALN